MADSDFKRTIDLLLQADNPEKTLDALNAAADAILHTNWNDWRTVDIRVIFDNVDRITGRIDGMAALPAEERSQAKAIMEWILQTLQEAARNREVTLERGEYQARDQALQRGDTQASNQEQPPEQPAWWTTDNGDTGIIDAVFASEFSKKCGWTRTGYAIRTESGDIVTETDALRTIVNEVRTYCPRVTFQKAKRLFYMTRLYLPEEKAADEMDLCSAAALDTMPLQPLLFNVNQLLPAGLTILAAPPKTGKSWLCLALADAIATGTKFFGMDTRQGACLYCALEDSQYRIQERLRKIGSSMPSNLHIITKGTKRLDNGLLLQLEKWIKSEPTARLVIIDTLARVRPLTTSGLDAYNQDTATISPLQALALKHGVSIVCITHYRKTYQAAMDSDPYDRITGSNGLFAVADSAWLVYGKRGGEDMTFRTTGRDAMDTELKIEFDKESCRWQIIGTAEAVEAQKQLDAYHASPLARTVRKLVRESGAWHGTATDLLLAVAQETGESGGDPRSIGSTLAEFAPLFLKEDGIHFAKDEGGRKGRAYTFQRVK